ncbi:MAG: DUF3237 domain-containing protein [Desulfobacteraceae bacterium]|nr:DUF3237 domain-containing protein [Desulfobacteraceae bacterium]MBU4001902.1 DUF3237 domain-containing protein [Pseudomonadota bacterium]MBU4055141.1 DUF3237 domain-containing protein [Pseudomonadota bacterium]
MESNPLPNEIHTEFVFEAKVGIGSTLVIGPSSRGKSQLIPITGGTFSGPNIQGTVVPGGADWQCTRPDGVMTICARYTLKTHDNALISVVNKGLVHMGKNPDGSPLVYVRTVPAFEAPVGPYDWLNKSIFLGTLTLAPPRDKQVIIRVYRVF